MPYKQLKSITPALAKDSKAILADFADCLQIRQPQWYGGLEKHEIVERIRSYIEQVLYCMQQGTIASMDEYLSETGRLKIQEGMGVHDVVEGSLVGKSVLSRSIQRNFPAANECSKLQQELDAFYVDIIALIAERYSAMLKNKLEEEHARTKLLVEVSRTISGSLDPDAIMERLAQALSEVVEEGCCTIYLADQDTGGLYPRAGWGYGSECCWNAMNGIRLCAEGNHIHTSSGDSYGICSRNVESSSFVNTLPEAMRSGWVNIFPISVADKMLGVALLASRNESFSFNDELNSLVESILNSVAVAIESAANEQRTQRKLKESEGLRRVAHKLLQEPDASAENTLSLICDEALGIVGGTGSTILLRDANNLKYAFGTGEPQPPLHEYPITETRYGQIFTEGKTTILTNAQKDIPPAERSTIVRTLIVVPLKEGCEKIGLLLVSNKPTGFDLDDARIMEMFAAQAVLALRNVRLGKQGEMLAVAGERQRLARELHDSVTQALYAANLCAEAASRSLLAGKIEGAGDQLQALRGMTKQAMRDMRSLIFDLHPPELESQGLVGALQARLNSVEARSGLNPDFRIEGGEQRLPLAVEEELFRVAIEALNNSAKHSQAEQVTVILDFGDQNISLTVADNGKGFDTEKIPTGGMGMRSMKERAQRLNGDLHITSTAKSGTRIMIHAPVTT